VKKIKVQIKVKKKPENRGGVVFGCGACGHWKPQG
jgi:hypothetical protein